MDVINDLAAAMGPEQKVNLTEPKVVILVEVFRVRLVVLLVCYGDDGDDDERVLLILYAGLDGRTRAA